MLALVVPVKIVEGTGWKNTRKLLARSYENIVVVTISSGRDITSESRAFSADTGIAEAIIVATRRADETTHPGQTASNRPQNTAYAILYNRPDTSAAAVEAARTIATATSNELRSLSVGDQAIGWAINAKLDPSGGGHPSGVSNPDVAQAALSLTGGQIALPPHETLSLAITPIRTLGSRGPIDRDINGSLQGVRPTQQRLPEHVQPVGERQTAQPERLVILVDELDRGLP